MSFFNPDKEAMSPLQRNLLLIMRVFRAEKAGGHWKVADGIEKMGNG